jgi:diaminohydroxyphosphoribosylaminopyrimidine deaminase/5-amino-6-(5-phosphoribosylamino)uracil reductase
VITGVEADASRRLNRHYLHHRTTGRPWVTLKLGMSLDGRIADASGRSQWITSPACRRHAHALRALHDAILVGAGTALSDDPELSLHGAPGMPPQRFLLVGQRDLPRSLRLFAGEQPATTIGVDARADWVVAADARGWPDLGSVLTRLGQEGHTGLLVEGGGRVATALLSAHLVCRMVIYYGHLILGEGRSALEGIAFPLDSAPKLSEVDVESLEGGFVVSGLTER